MLLASDHGSSVQQFSGETLAKVLRLLQLGIYLERRGRRLGLTVVKMGSALQRVNDPCAEKLEVYVRCVEAHKDVAPAEYGGEYCEEEKER